MKHGAVFDMDGLMFDTERLFRESWMVLAREKFHQEPNLAFTKAVAGTAGDKMREVIRQYYPDFIAKMSDGSYRLIEVKGDNMIDDAVVLAKKEYARQIAAASNMEYMIILC